MHKNHNPGLPNFGDIALNWHILVQGMHQQESMQVDNSNRNHVLPKFVVIVISFLYPLNFVYGIT